MLLFMNTILPIFLVCEAAAHQKDAVNGSSETKIFVEAGLSPRASGLKIWGHDYSTEYVAFALFLGLRINDFSMRAIGQTPSIGPSLGYTGAEADWRFWRYNNGIGSMFIRLTFGNQSFFHEPMVARKTDRLEAGFLIGSDLHLCDRFFISPAIGIVGGAYTKSNRKSLLDVAHLATSLNVGVKF